MANRRYAPALAQKPESTKLVKHKLDSLDETNEEYEPSTFGGFSDYMRRKKIKLQNQDALIRARAPEDTPAIFSGMTIHINGYTKPGRVELWNMIVTYGGVYKQYLEGKTDVTHIIASNLTKKKQEEFAKYRIVRPEWIIDSIAAGKVLPWSDPAYRVIDAGQNQHTLKFGDAQGISLGDGRVSSSYKRVSEVDSSSRTVAPVVPAAKVEEDEPRPVNTDKPLPLPPVDEMKERIDAFHSGPTKLDKDSIAEPKDYKSRPGTKTAKDPDFIQDYFRNSRLHHLSSWKANLRMKIDNLSKANHPWVNQQAPPQKYVMHVDFDCFFAAVSSRGRPDLVGKVCAVTHGGSNAGEIASCNYEARKYGIKNGMWMKEAVKLYADIVSLPYDFEAYEAASERFYETLLSLDAAVVEAVSIDEALVNITNLVPVTEDAKEIEMFCMALAGDIRETIRKKTGVEVSVGIGANVLLSKLAIKRAKPAGQFYLGPDRVREVLDTFSVSSIPGVGWSTEKKLEQNFQITQIKELLPIAESKLQEVFGPKTGTSLYRACRGLDDTIVGDINQRKLVSIEINWGIRLDTPSEVSDYIRRVCDELCRKLTEVGFASAQHLLVKVMRRAKDAPVDPPKFLGHGPCDKFNAGREIPNTGDAAIIWKHALALLEGLHIPPNELRGIGIALTKLQAIGSVAQRSVAGYFDTAGVAEVKQTKSVAFKEPLPKTPTKKMDVLPSHTQFVVPSQIDATVLAELPSPIRRKIESVQVQGTKDIYDIPSISQIDPADLAALPASVRHEILMNSRPISRSPSKSRNVSINKFLVKTPSPKKVKSELKVSERGLPKNLTKTFSRVSVQTPIITSSPSDDIDREVLAGLPDDIRKEVLAADRARKIAQARKRQKEGPVAIPEVEDKVRRTYELPGQEDEPEIGDLANESIDGLREYLSTWFQESEDGPDQDDFLDFQRYLHSLVSDRDFEKVETLVRWFWKLVESSHEWTQAVMELTESVQSFLLDSGFSKLKL